MRTLLLILLAICAWAQNPNTSSFPTTVAVDQDLGAAKTRSSSTLTTSINASTLTVVVGSGVSFIQYQVISIDSEEMMICSIATNTLTICTGTRGLGDTAAASHTAGAAVRGVISAYYTNQITAEMKAVQARLRDATAQCVDAGASDTYACNPAPSLGAYAIGQRVSFKAATANTGAATANFNSLGAVAIKKVAGGITTDLADNDIRANQWVDLVYDGTNFQMRSMLGNAADLAAYLLSATLQAGTPQYCRSTAGSDTYACSVTPALTAYTRGGCLVLDGDAANTGAATVDVNALGAKSILNRAGGALSNNDITANKPITICYDGTQYIIQGDGGGSGSGDATISEVQSDSYKRCTSSGATATYTCTMTPTLTAYTDGMVVLWRQSGNSSPSNSASTLNIDTLGAKAIKWSNATLGDSDTNATTGVCVPWQNQEMRLVFSASADAFLMQGCPSFGSGTLGTAVRRTDVTLNTYDTCSLSGSSPTFTCTMSSVTSYSVGMHLYLFSSAAITAAATVNVSSLGALDVVQPDGFSPLSSSCPIPEDTPVLAVLDSSGTAKWRMVSCPSGAIVLMTSSTRATIAAHTASNGAVLTTIAEGTADISAGDGVAYIQEAPDGTVIVGHNGLTIACDADCTVQAGVTGPISGYKQLGSCAATTGAWTSCTDVSQATGFQRIASGSNINVSYDAAGTAIPALTSTVDLTSYTLLIPNSNTLPGSCSPGQVYQKNDATSGQQFYACESGTLVPQGGSGTAVTKVPHSVWIDLGSQRNAAESAVTNGCVMSSGAAADVTTPKMYGVIFPNTSTPTAECVIMIPRGWDAGTVAIDMVSTFDSNAGAQTARIQFANATVADAASLGSPSYGTATNFDFASGDGSASLKRRASATGVTLTGTPVAGDLLFVRIQRPNAGAPDDLADNIYVGRVQITFWITLE